MLYDSEGSRLFACITTLPEYYPTRTERDILAKYAEAIITATGSDYCRAVRLLGTAAKTGILLEAATRLRNDVIYFRLMSRRMPSMRRATASVACCRMCS
jgi:L-histidine N-alpha-methyltransferase